MSNVIHEKKVGKYVCKVIVDDCPTNPRDINDNVCTLVCFSSKYTIGDKTKFPNNRIGMQNFNEYLKENEDNIFKVPLFLYDHSGITISTKPFKDQWDSYPIGYAYLYKDKFIKEFGFEEWNKEAEAKAVIVINAEVKEYDCFLRGEVYGYEITKEGEEEVIHSCWGYVGHSEQCLEDAIAKANALVEEDLKWEKEATESVRYLTIKVTLKHNKDISPEDVLDACEYSFKSTHIGAIIKDTEIQDYSESRYDS